jgi:hypothetical protein
MSLGVFSCFIYITTTYAVLIVLPSAAARVCIVVPGSWSPRYGEYLSPRRELVLVCHFLDYNRITINKRHTILENKIISPTCGANQRIMTGVYQRWCSSTLHIGWGLCDRLCLVLVCRGRYGLGRVVLLFNLGSNFGGVGPVRGLRGGGRKGCDEASKQLHTKWSILYELDSA